MARVRDALRIPNAELRWRPEEKATSSPEERAASLGSGENTAAMARQVGASQGGSGRRGRGGPRAAQTVYKLSTGKEEPVAVQIRTGISDGRVTQIVSGPLVPGEQVVTGAVTTKADSSGSAVPVGGARGAGGGRRGF